MPPIYDAIGHGYARRRRTEPRIAARIHAALGDARTVLNVGAGAGAYEPRDRHVVAVEPSAVMARQRDPGLPPAVLARAEALPLVDDAVDASMGVLTVHHWDDVDAGIGELLRVTRRTVILLTIDAAFHRGFWLVADYLPQLGEREEAAFPAVECLRARLGPRTTVTPVPVPHDCADGFFESFWSRPEAVLDPEARAATSGFARLPDGEEAAAVAQLEADLGDGTWDRRHGRLRGLSELDTGLRLVVADVSRS